LLIALSIISFKGIIIYYSLDILNSPSMIKYIKDDGLSSLHTMFALKYYCY